MPRPAMHRAQLTHMAARKATDEDHAIRRLLRDISRTLKVHAYPN